MTTRPLWPAPLPSSIPATIEPRRLTSPDAGNLGLDCRAPSKEPPLAVEAISS